ncbi:MAG: superoxide dismutase [Pseudomonadota bacterium]
MAFELPKLPYNYSDLEPHISAKTLEIHHGRHHQTYVTNLNKLTEGKPMASRSLEDVILENADAAGIFNNAAQIWNHTFYWNCMRPNGGGDPSGSLKDRLEAEFGSLEKFKQEFHQAAITQFGSGWAWLIEDQGQLKIMKTGNADLPLAHSKRALLTCDVWEHAYYLDYQNRRPDYVKTFLDSLVNWDFVASQLES